MTPWTDDDLDRAVDAIRALRPALTEGDVPLSPPSEEACARAVLDTAATTCTQAWKEGWAAAMKAVVELLRARGSFDDLDLANAIEAQESTR